MMWLVGLAGFEPAASCSQSRRAAAVRVNPGSNAAATPPLLSVPHRPFVPHRLWTSKIDQAAETLGEFLSHSASRRLNLELPHALVPRSGSEVLTKMRESFRRCFACEIDCNG